ncbi:MAG: hypothetical protein ACLFV6_12340 [Spirulinaceae cyanobacterium]
MNRRVLLFFLMAIAGCGFSSSISRSTSKSQAVSTATDDDFLNINLAEIPVDLRNSWPPELEAEFQAKARNIINFHQGKPYGNTHQENEKRAYAKAMFDFLAGHQEDAIAFLQSEDVQAEDHRHTAGIDYYYSFTLKNQIRKYFLFGKYLDPDYQQRMFAGAKLWTEQDPLTRPHPVYGNGDGSGKDWSIQRRGKWVDGRNTDNLRAMREVAIYLMAEETQNETVRQIYAEKLHRYVSTLYNIGMGEWDSENYHNHTFAAYLNLYDFAQNLEIKALGKAALDWLSIAAAIKYFRGGWGGPIKRDYGLGNVVFGSAAARSFYLYFGDTFIENHDPDLNTLHFITSPYRPPMVAVAIARKQFSKSLELFATKPLYENWKAGNSDRPGYWETNFFGHTYQMGSLVSAFPDGDVAPFKLMAENPDRGVDFFVVNTSEDWVKPGKNPGDQIAQFRNLLIWLRPNNNRDFYFQFPKNVTWELRDRVWFIQLAQTWIALFPINLNSPEVVTIADEKHAQNYASEVTLKATALNNSYSGFALEIGEPQTHGKYAQFKRNVNPETQLNLGSLNRGYVALQGRDRNTLSLQYNSRNLLPLIRRNSTLHRWSDHFAVYDPVSGEIPVSQGWKTGQIHAQTTNYEFSNSGATQLK